MTTLATHQIAGVHPYADKFPMLPEAELDELAESIRANGLRQPIVITDDGLILDGRNRYAACQKVGIAEPEMVVYDGDDLAEYVIDSNVTRRNISTGARAAATALILVADGRRENGRWRRGSVDISQSSNSDSAWRTYLAKAGTVVDFAPGLAERVVSGDLALDAAYRQAEERRHAERNRLAEQERIDAEEADAKAFIEDNAPDLATRVDGTDLLTYVEARDLWNRRNREEAARIKAEEAKREAAERAEREQAEQEVQLSARALHALAGARYPEWRERVRAAHSRYPEAVEPAARAMWTPENLRLISTWLSTLADEMETGQ